MIEADVLAEAEAWVTRDAALRCPYPVGLVTEDQRAAFDAHLAAMMDMRPPLGVPPTDSAFTATVRRIGWVFAKCDDIDPAKQERFYESFGEIRLLLRDDLEAAALAAVTAERAALAHS